MSYTHQPPHQLLLAFSAHELPRIEERRPTVTKQASIQKQRIELVLPPSLLSTPPLSIARTRSQ